MPTNNPQIPEPFKVLFEWTAIVTDVFAKLGGVRAIIMVSPATVTLGITMDNIEGKTWDQIVGKMFGTVLDAYVVGRIGSLFKAESYVEKIRNGTAEGFVVWGMGKTDYSAASYFEKAFPIAVDFYKQLLTDEDAARLVWQGLKENNNVPAYFANLTFEQFMSDAKDLFNPSYTVPIGGYGVQFEGDKATVVAPDGSDGQAVIVNDILSNRGQVTKIDIGSITYDITQGDNLLVRNAIFDIPKVSFLLSHILIKVGDILDIGDKGLYEVVSDDTMSELAEKFGMTTQQLLSYNTWLIDEGRVEFDQDKVLVANLEPSDFTDKDHNLLGCELEDRLIDHNDGDDTLLGMGGDDYLDGGKGADQLIGGTGFDTYISDNGDKIFDEDGEGEVYFDETLLTGGKKEEGSGCEPTEDDGSSVYKGNGGTYTLSGDTLTFEKGGETLTILNFNDKRMVA